MGQSLLTTALDGGERSVSRLSRFTPGEGVHITYRIGGYMGPKACLNTMKKRQISYFFRESNHDSLVVQFVA